MRIGIITYHRADNFGAVIQTYALLSYLREQGHEVEVIDYRCRTIEAQYQVFSPAILLLRKNIFSSLRQYLSRYVTLRSRIVRRRKFREFRTSHLLDGRLYRALPESWDYDVVITGSDQVWNFHLNKGSERIYLLDVPMSVRTKRIAYAASSEMNGFAQMKEGYLRKCFEGFNKISVRECFLADKIKAMIGRKIDITLDPTFLLGREIYQGLAVHPHKRNYILVFHMTDISEYVPFIQDIARKKQMKVIEVYGGFHRSNTDSRISDWGPLEMLGYINDAEVVFTTSFHGLALSLILEKDVWVIDKGENQRQRQLLQMAGLTNRMLKRTTDYDTSVIDYRKVEQKIMPYIERSKTFLNSI